MLWLKISTTVGAAMVSCRSAGIGRLTGLAELLQEFVRKVLELSGPLHDC